MSNGMTNPFEEALPTVESLGMPITMTPMDAIKFAKYIIDVLGHKGPMGPEEWVEYGARWKKESGYASSGTTTPGTGSSLEDYAADRNASTTDAGAGATHSDPDYFPE